VEAAFSRWFLNEPLTRVLRTLYTSTSTVMDRVHSSIHIEIE
jgi:hypothetical protein